MQDVFTRVCKWNAARYDQDYNHELALNLLREEYQEWLEATTPVDKLDAVCDITYIAMGAIWKTGNGLSFDMMQHAYLAMEAVLDVEVSDPIFLTAMYLDDATVNAQDDCTWLYHILAVAGAQALSSGLSMDEYTAAMNVVCDSNDSKTIKKTASNAKANVDKGVYFIAPEARLQLIIDGADKCQQLKLH